MTHPLDDLTDEQRADVLRAAPSWIADKPMSTTTMFAKALLTALEERDELVDQLAAALHRQQELLAPKLAPVRPPVSPWASSPPRTCRTCDAAWTIQGEGSVYACPNGHGPWCSIPTRDLVDPEVAELRSEVARLKAVLHEALRALDGWVQSESQYPNYEDSPDWVMSMRLRKEHGVEP